MYALHGVPLYTDERTRGATEACFPPNGCMKRLTRESCNLFESYFLQKVWYTKIERDGKEMRRLQRRLGYDMVVAVAGSCVGNPRCRRTFQTHSIVPLSLPLAARCGSTTLRSKMAKTRLSDPASWFLLAAGASSRNLVFTL